MLYVYETWTVYQRHIRKLNRFHLTCLCKLLRIDWRDMIPETEVLRCTGLPGIDTMFTKAQLRWSGHIVRMREERLPKRLLYGELQEGKRSVGRQRKRYKDILAENCLFLLRLSHLAPWLPMFLICLLLLCSGISSLQILRKKKLTVSKLKTSVALVTHYIMCECCSQACDEI